MPKTPNSQQVEVNVVGSSVFGRYSKISDEKTFNMFVSDGWLVNYAGYEFVSQLSTGGEGRGLFHSVRGDFMVAVVGSSVFKIESNLAPLFVGSIDTSQGEVSIDENLNGQIAIADGANVYIYHWATNVLTKQALGVS